MVNISNNSINTVNNILSFNSQTSDTGLKLNWKEKLLANFEFSEQEKRYVFAPPSKVKDLVEADLKEAELKFIEFIEELIKNVNNDYDWSQILNAINIDTVSNEGLIIILSFLQKKQNEVPIKDTWKIASYRRICFELKNTIYSKAWNNILNENELTDQAREMGFHDLADKLKNINTKSTTLTLYGNDIRCGDDPTAIFKNARMDHLHPNTTLDLNHEKPRVLVASLEYVKAKVGGVGAVATELLGSMNKHGQDARIITPLYNTYVSEYYDQLEFVGVIEHPFKGKWIQSTIYSTKTQEGTVTQYFVKPPKTHLKINDIGESSDIYTSTHETKIVDRTQFLTSAAAAFASSYIGDDKNTPFQVLHTNSWILGFAGELLTDYYNPMREKAGLNRLAHVAHVHGTGYTEQGRGLTPTLFDDLGLKRPEGLDYAKVNMQAHTYGTSSDCDIHPSNWSAESSKTKKGGYGLQNLVIEKARQGRLVGIRNGIARDSYDPTLPKIYGEYAFKQTFKDGIDTTDYIAQRDHVKQKLFQENIIASKTKPLFLYVGRLDGPTKGVDALPAMVKQIHAEGGQCVVMGVLTGDAKADKALKALKKFQKKHPETLKVFTDLKADQLDILKGTQAQKGKLIRLASDFVIVPSHKESDGLVPKEALTCGAMLISSNVEGLQDTTLGYGDVLKGQKITKENFNGFSYRDNFFFKLNGRQAIKRSMKLFKALGNEEKNQIIGRLIKDSESFDWKLAIDKVNEVYKKAIEPRTKDEKASMKELEKKFYKRHFSLKVLAHTLLRKLKLFLKYIFSKIAVTFKKIRLPSRAKIDGNLKAA